MRTVLLTAAAAFAGIAPLSAQLPPWLNTAAVRQAFEAEWRATRTPGAALAIVADGRVIWTAALGVANNETGQPMTAATLVRIGSVTKAITGITAALLAHAGIVDLAAPIRRTDRSLHRAIGRLTLRDLLAHTAGMINEAAHQGPQDLAALAPRVRGWSERSLIGPPGDVYSYSSPGYWLAGHVLQQAAGMPYDSVVAAHLLRPLGMTRSTFQPTMALTWPMAQDHRVERDTVRLLRPYVNDATTWPSGSLFSSAAEMGRLAAALLSGGRLEGRQVLAPEAVAAVLTPGQPAAGNGCGYAYGLSACRRAGLMSFGHYGFRGGSGAVFTLLPERGVGIVILANRNGGIFARTEQAILRLVAADGAAGTAPAVPGLLAAPSAEQLAGVWVSGPDTIRVTREGTQLRYRFGSQAASAAEVRGEALAVLDAGGQVTQQFVLIRGERSGRLYLHDGLGAWRRAGR